MGTDWTLVFTTTKAYMAELAKQMFLNQKIEAVVLNKRDSSYNSFGELEVYVKNDDKETALVLIKELEN
jgi:hypothetical protein